MQLPVSTLVRPGFINGRVVDVFSASLIYQPATSRALGADPCVYIPAMDGLITDPVDSPVGAYGLLERERWRQLRAFRDFLGGEDQLRAYRTLSPDGSKGFESFAIARMTTPSVEACLRGLAARFGAEHVPSEPFQHRFPHRLRSHLTGVTICHDVRVDLLTIRAEHQTLLRVLQEMMLILMGPSIAEINQSPTWDYTPSFWEAERFHATKAEALARAYTAAKERDAEEGDNC